MFNFPSPKIAARLQCHHVRISTAWMWLKAGPQRGGAEMHPWNHRQNDDEQLDFGALYFQLFSDKAIVCFQTFCHVQTIFQFQNTSDSIEPSLWEACHRHCFGWATPLDQTGLHRLHSRPGDDGEFSNFLMGTRFLDLLQGTRSNFLMVFMVEPWKK